MTPADQLAYLKQHRVAEGLSESEIVAAQEQAIWEEGALERDLWRELSRAAK